MLFVSLSFKVNFCSLKTFVVDFDLFHIATNIIIFSAGSWRRKSTPPKKKVTLRSGKTIFLTGGLFDNPELPLDMEFGAGETEHQKDGQ